MPVCLSQQLCVVPRAYFLRDSALNEIGYALRGAQFLAYHGVEGELAEEKKGDAGYISTSDRVQIPNKVQMINLISI